MTTIADRAAEILAGWDADYAAEERRDAHAEWVAYMLEVERVCPETQPCVHSTAMWPDRGQVCGACEAEAEEYAYKDRAPEQIVADRHRAALSQAEHEAARAAEPDPWAGSNGWADCPF